MLQLVSRGAALGQKLIDNQRQIDLLLLEQSRLAAAFVETDFWEEEGFSTPYDWIRINCHLTSNVVGDRAAVGERLSELSESVQAMRAGEVGYTHLVVMARTADAVGDRFDESYLLDKARKSSPGKFRHTCDHYRHSADPDGYAAEQFRKYEQRHLTFSRWDDGSLIVDGVLDPLGGLALRKALEPLARKSGAHDDRTRDQRLADALVELAVHGGKQNVSLHVTSSIETLLGVVGAPGAEAEISLPISSKTVERWACDCSLTRILMQDSVVIDVGRAERTIKGPRRRALIARDQHCQWTGCERSASLCEGHHLVHWLHGGGSELENQVLLCYRHHLLVHEGGWQLVRTDGDGVMPIAPTFQFVRSRSPD